MKKLLLTALLFPVASLLATQEVSVQAEEEVAAQVKEEAAAEETRSRSCNSGAWHDFVASLIENDSELVEAALNHLAMTLSKETRTKLPSKNRVAKMYQAACEKENRAVDLAWFYNLYDRLVALLQSYLKPADATTEEVVCHVVAEDNATDAELGLEEAVVEVPAEAPVEAPAEEVVTPSE